MGRHAINYSKDLIENKYKLKILFIDTDSLTFQYDKDIKLISKAIENDISSVYANLLLKYEDTYKYVMYP